MWTWSDLPSNELYEFAGMACHCRTPERSGNRNGYRCNAHQASDELARRRLVSAAAEAIEIFGDDELERAAGNGVMRETEITRKEEAADG